MKKFKKKSFEFKAEKFDDEKGVITGYGGVKNNRDHAGDIITDGAFGDSKTIPFLFQHDPSQQIGVLDCYEDSHGLKMTAKYYLNTSLGKEAYELAKANSENDLDTSFSIGFRTLKESYGEEDGKYIRYLEKVDVREISQVTFPCNELATATDIKSLEDITAREVEHALRDVDGMSNSLAKKYANVICKGLREEDGEDDGTTEDSIKDIEVEDQIEPNAQEDETDNGDELLSELKNIFELETLKLKLETM